MLWIALSHGAAKEGTEPVTAPPIDQAPCFAAAEAQDDDKIIAMCGPLIDGEKTLKADRIKALIARAGAYDRKDQIDRAIGDDAIASIHSEDVVGCQQQGHGFFSLSLQSRRTRPCMVRESSQRSERSRLLASVTA